MIAQGLQASVLEDAIEYELPFGTVESRARAAGGARSASPEFAFTTTNMLSLFDSSLAANG